MKRSIFISAALGVMVSLATGCGGGTSETQEAEPTTGEAVMGAVGEAVETAVDAVEDATMGFESEVEAKLTSIQRGIANLKSQAGEYGDDAVQQANQVLGPLDEQRQAIQQDLAGLQDESGEAMETMRAGIESAVAELERAYQEARSQLAQ